MSEKARTQSAGMSKQERADPRTNPANKDKNLSRKIRHAESEGVKKVDIASNTEVDDEIKRCIDERI